ncbi:MAG: putative cytosol aminopeptidase [Pseudomonadota bacterium]
MTIKALSVKTGLPEKQKNTCFVVAVFEKRQLSGAAQRLDEIGHGFITKAIKLTHFEAKLSQTLWLSTFPDRPDDQVLLVGCGVAESCNDKAYIQALRAAMQKLDALHLAHATFYLTDIPLQDRDIVWKMTQAALIAGDIAYEFKQFKSEKNRDASAKNNQKWVFNVSARREVAAAEKGLETGQVIAEEIASVKNWINTPPNVCNPSFLAQEAVALGKKNKKLSVAVLNEKEIRALKMGALLAVGQGSAQPPKFITLQYNGGKKNAKPIVFVGKGITMDTGGLCLKPPTGIVGMKYDMSGAACVMGVLSIVARLGLPLNVIGLVPTAENMVSGSAYRPDDILTSMSGQTIEVLNTDAEGRLILCDALTYAERFHPAYVIDLATLTGACVVALGKQATGLFSNHQPLADALLVAGQVSGDRLWQLPVWEEYQEQLNSQVADMANVGGSEAGAITAACFLARFTKAYHWAHLDIAGTACRSTGKDKMASGRPIPALIQFLQTVSQQEK